MVDLNVLRQRGITVESIRTLVESDNPPEAWEKCRKRIWGRAQDGITYNCKNYKLFLAIDKAFDAAFYQLSPTLVQGLANQDPNKNAVLEIFKALDLTHYLKEEKDPKTSKPTGRKTLDLPTFFQITISIVYSYVQNRWAKLCNDRDKSPCLKYEPFLDDPEERQRCEVLTSRIDLMANQYGYYEVRKQSILKMLQYAECFRFIETEWDREEQLRYEDGGIKPVCMKEGLNYYMPHPTRMYRDRSHAASRFLTDNGPQWAGYWRLKRYGEIKENPAFWNRDKITVGSDWISAYSTYFQTVYPCVMQFPQTSQKWSNDAAVQLSEQSFYNSNYEDCATMLVEHFEKLIPKDNGLGDYPYPVWFRFVLAGDGTVVYGAPLPSVPVIYYGASVDDGRSQSASMALQLIPFQDGVSNALTQAILTAKQNLSSMVWIDEYQMPENRDIARELENAGEAYYRSRKFYMFNSRYALVAKQGADVNKAVIPVSFPQMDVRSSIEIVNMLLNILQRVIQISAQEVGATASHEQSKAEVIELKGASTNQLRFVGNPIDRADDAWKKQLYNYLMNYGEEEIWAEISYDPQLTRERLEQLGFTVQYEPKPEIGGKRQVSVKKSALLVDYFTATKEGDDRTNQVELANAMAQFMPAVLTNQAILQAVGPEQAINLLNQIFERMGLPKDFKLRNLSGASNPQEFGAQIMEQVQKLIAQAGAETTQQIMQALDPVIKGLKAQIDEQAQATSKIAQILEQAQTAPVNAQPPMPSMPNPNDTMPNNPMVSGAGPAVSAMAVPAGGGPVGEIPLA